MEQGSFRIAAVMGDKWPTGGERLNVMWSGAFCGCLGQWMSVIHWHSPTMYGRRERRAKVQAIGFSGPFARDCRGCGVLFTTSRHEQRQSQPTSIIHHSKGPDEMPCPSVLAWSTESPGPGS